MSPIRCPQCGLINHPEDVGFPRCGQCHEDLARCDHCCHQHGNGCKHPQSYTLFTPDMEAAKRCPTFQSRYELHGPRLLWALPAPLWVPLLLLLIMLGLALTAVILDPTGRFIRGNPLRLETTVQKPIIYGLPFTVDLTITNTFHQPSTHLYIEIDQEFLKGVTAEKPDPEPLHYTSFPDRLLLEYAPIPAYGGSCKVHFIFTPRKRVIAPFTARIYAPSNQFRTLVRVPIRVVNNAKTAIGEKTGGQEPRQKTGKPEQQDINDLELQRKESTPE